jgi:hypothetical protein
LPPPLPSQSQQQRGGRGGQHGPRRPPVVASDDESSCWFCVGSPKAELELLVTIGEGLYMAVPKARVVVVGVVVVVVVVVVEHVLLIPIRQAHILPPSLSLTSQPPHPT